MTIADLRQEYRRASLSEHEVLADPLAQFTHWFDEARTAEVPEANAMSVATSTADGRPSVRILLIKGVDARGFVWYTNYASRKGQELAQNPHAALLFHWVQLERQVRIEGTVERLRDEENDAYFHSRPLGSRIGALASAQSETISSREALEAQFNAAEAEYGESPPRPPHWGGFRLLPERIEFWQGRPSRLHDRILYLKAADGSWTRQRLQP